MPPSPEDPLKATSAFLRFESENNLYSLRTVSGKYYWSVLRHEVIRVIFGIGRRQKPRKFKKTKLLPKIARFGRMLLRWGCIFLFPPAKYRYVMYTNSRTRNDEGEQYDLYQDHIWERIREQCLWIESHDNKGAFPYKYGRPLLYPILILHPLLTDALVNRLVKEDFRELRSLLRQHYPEYNISLTFLRRYYLWYRLDYLFYSFLFKRLPRLKGIFFIRNNTQTGLIEAARKHGITIVEAQHGIPYKNAIPSPHFPTVYPEGAIPKLDYLLSFSSYAQKCNEYPTFNTLTLGNDILARKKDIPTEVRNRFRTLMVVPQLSDSALLEELSITFAEENPEWALIFKVKPSNFDQLEHCQKRFAEQENIRVVGGERDMMTLLDEVHAVLLTHSTTFYEAMHRQVKCLVYQRSNYMMFKDNFDLPNVYLVDNVKEVEVALQQPLVDAPELHGLFYQPFDPAALEQVLREIDEKK